MKTHTFRNLAAVLTLPLVLSGAAQAQLVWSQVHPPSLPAARFGHALSAISTNEGTLLFGGSNGAVDLADTWTWGHATPLASSPIVWTLRPGPGPSARHDHALARADLADGVLLFGGRDASGALNGETWMWRPYSWAQVTTVNAPSPRANHALAIDEWTADVVYLFGGRTASGLSDELWRFQNNTWTQIVTTRKPSAREDHVLAWNAGAGGMLLTGGRDASGVLADEWVFDGSDWQPFAATDADARSGHSMVYQGVWRRRHVAVGGVDGGADLDVVERTNDGRWLHHATATSPSARTDTSLALSSELFTTQVVLFGGRDSAGAALGDMWMLQPAADASIESFGAGCGPGPWGPAGPHVFADPAPLIGSRLQVAAIGGAGMRRALLLIGSERPQQPFGQCGLLVDTSLRAAAPVESSSGLPFAFFELDLPFDTNLVGTTISMQAIGLSSAGAAFSRGLRLHVEE